MKIHRRDTKEKAKNWKQSPHIEGAIREGCFTRCRIIAFPEKVTDENSKVTCKVCKEVEDGNDSNRN